MEDTKSWGNRHCYVVGCTNGDYGLFKWRKMLCATHGVANGTAPCDCPPPFELHLFPTKKMDADKRQQWLKVFSRPDPNKPHTLLEPKKGHRVCSAHFVDGKPTHNHPDPELCLGHTQPTGQKRNVDREGRHWQAKRAKLLLETPDDYMHQAPDHLPQPPVFSDKVKNCASQFIIYVLLVLLRRLKANVEQLETENKELRKTLNRKCPVNKRSLPLYGRLINTDKNTLFYTGIPHKSVFHKLHGFVCKFVNRRWRGKSSTKSKVRQFSSSPLKSGPRRTLNSRDEFLLTLMKIRLGSLNRDLADRFGISLTLVSQIFQTWITAMSKVFSGFIVWPDKRAVQSTTPQRYKHLPDLRAIIDCSEILLETPKDLQLQSATWSDYKHHNTGKFLISVAPNSSITYVSSVYGGRATDKAVTLESGFLDMLDPYDLLQADKGFNIQEDCAARLITLYTPPGKRGGSQMSSAALKKPSRIANLRILVEQVIRRLKTFRILKYEIPITVIPCLDEIVTVCAALSNLRDPIYKT